MLKTLKLLFLAIGLITFAVACGDDSADCTTTCASGEVLDINCNCVAINPCDGITCAAGEILTANCDCIEDNSGTSVITKSGILDCSETWTKDKIYVLSGKVIVTDGCTLTIEAGTVIKGEDDPGTLASALVIARGAKLFAQGTSSEPIIFTSVTDQIVSGQIVSPNLDEFDNQLWGGLIILGKAPISAADGDNEALIEGLPPGEGIGEYGGNDPADNSGVIRYVSVRHGGISIGADNEINGITFGGVGNGTVVENIEVVANLDDGVEWFGGTVNCSNVVVAYGEDDGLDIDQNYSGTITNAVVIQSGATAGDNALEIDGPEGSLTDGFFMIDGITLIDKDGEADTAADLKSKTQGTIRNASWRGYGDNIKLRSSCEESDCMTTKSDSYQNYIDGNLVIENSEWVGGVSVEDWMDVYGDKDCVNDEKCIISDMMQTDAINILSAANNDNNSTATKGADITVFDSWSWVKATGNL